MSTGPVITGGDRATVTVQPDFEGGPSFPPQHLHKGESCTFGRGPGSDVDVGLAPDDRAVSRMAGVIEARGRHWRITNPSRNKTYVVEHTDRIPGYVQVRPGMRQLVIPFETARVRIPGGRQEYTFLVMAPEQGPMPGPEVLGKRPTPPDATTEGVYRLDPWNTYFRVLVALCEPQLRGSPVAVVPTQPQVAERLGLSRPAVSAHIEYLLNQKLRIGSQGRSAGLDWRTQTLVDYALRFGLVTSEDLRLLPDS